MNFWHYLNVDKSHDLQGLSEGTAARFAELLQRGHSIADLVTHYGDDFGHLPTERLTKLHDSRRRWLAWSRRRKQLDEIRHGAKLPALPKAVVQGTVTPDQLDALFRAARLCQRKSFDSDEQFNAALEAGLNLWKLCLALCRKDAVAHTELTRASHPDAERYDAYARQKVKLDEIASHRWLAMRRGEKEKVLSLELELPKEALLEQVTLHQRRLGKDAEARSVESLLDELVLDDIKSWLLRIVDLHAEAEAISHASATLIGLLRSTPLQARRVAAIFIGRPKSPMGVAIADRDGELLGHKVLKAEGAWLKRLSEFLDEHGPSHLVLPTGAPATEIIAELENHLASEELAVIKVRSAAIAEARRPLTDPPMRLSVSVASALVLARRALDPAKAWSSVDPVAIGVAEYQNDLDQDRLRPALKQAIELYRLERRKGKSAPGPAATRGPVGIARLNPLVKSLADLRPGMTVNGMITNISHFGAFINLGLPQEGLAHISELSDDYVANPNDVVTIGQQVTATVLSLDPGRGRISLSLKTTRASIERGDRRGGNRAPSEPPKSKAEALASLERLFKK